MSHTNFNAKVCKLGHTIICQMIDSNEKAGLSARTTRDEVAAELNKRLGLDADHPHLWDESDVRTAVRQGAFDTEDRMFNDMKGRYGGIRDVDVEGYKKAQAKSAAAKKAAETRAKAKAAAAKAE